MKDEKYSLNDVVNFAIKIENEGIFFYQKISEKTKIKSLKDLFIKLKNDEEEHKKTFEKFLYSLPKQEEFLYNQENQNIRYLHAIIENLIFNEEQLHELINLLIDELSVIEYAMSKEQDSIEFYKNMKALINEKNHPLIEKLIMEEEKHLKILEDFKLNIGNI